MTTLQRLTLTPLAFALAAAVSGQALADTQHNGPTFSGNVTGGVLDVSDRDLDLWAFRAEAGVGGVYTVNPSLRIRYDLIADFANAINSVDEQTWTPGAHRQDDGEIYIRTARVLLLTDFGSFGFQPRVPSGFWHQIYNNIDTFEYNRFHGQTGQNAIFGQAEQGSDVLSYGTPTFGGFQFIGAVMTTNAQNDQDFDVVTGRLVYNEGPLNFGIGHTQVRRPGIDNLHRTSFGIGYDFGMVQLGGVYEHNDDREDSGAASDFDAWGVNVSANLSDAWSVSLGYAENNRNFDLDNDAWVGIVRHHFNDKVYGFLEAGRYDRTDNNVAAGLSVSF
ncbi:porin [Billgrantia ethanolica]|uniref:Porin n=1 Tax=Billgrantia ethanolica TaxID=2733486 RepID=A0ABS9A9D5_9GAMM|nr:porin [Halomonas ethanolica]MCE8005152.1 porin [Halomonas ethanolica]